MNRHWFIFENICDFGLNSMVKSAFGLEEKGAMAERDFVEMIE